MVQRQMHLSVRRIRKPIENRKVQLQGKDLIRKLTEQGFS